MGIRLVTAALCGVLLLPLAILSQAPAENQADDQTVGEAGAEDEPAEEEGEGEEAPPPTAEQLQELQERLEQQEAELEVLREEREELLRAAEDAEVVEELGEIRNELGRTRQQMREVARAEQQRVAAFDAVIANLQLAEQRLAFGELGVRPILLEARSVLSGPSRDAVQEALFWLDRGDLYLTRVSIVTAIAFARQERDIAAGNATPVVP